MKIYGEISSCSKKGCGYYYDQDLGDERQNIKKGTLFDKLPENWCCPNCGSKKELFFEQTPKIQDDYSIRCTPQVLGASRDTFEYAKSIINREINAVTDNPLIFIKTEEPLTYDIYSGGNFHGEPIAMAMDYLAIAMAEVGNIAERRCAKIIDPNRNEGLTPFLIHSSAIGLNSGYMMPQYTAAALVSENKILASPATVDSIPTSADAEDHVSMSPLAARKVIMINENLKYVLAIEMILATQGIDIRCEIEKVKPEEVLGKKSLKAYKYIRTIIPKLTEDRILYTEIEKIAEKIVDQSIWKAIL